MMKKIGQPKRSLKVFTVLLRRHKAYSVFFKLKRSGSYTEKKSVLSFCLYWRSVVNNELTSWYFSKIIFKRMAKTYL
jgi:hypothetical protein